MLRKFRTNFIISIPIVVSFSSNYFSDRNTATSICNKWDTAACTPEESSGGKSTREREYLVISGTASRKLSHELCNELGVKLSSANMERFSDGEIFVRFNDSLREKDVFIVQTCAPPVNDNVMELLLSVAAAKRSGGMRMPLFLYSYSAEMYPCSFISDGRDSILWIQAQSPWFAYIDHSS